MLQIRPKLFLHIIIPLFLISLFLFGNPVYVQSLQIFNENAEAALGEKSDKGIIEMYGLYDDKVLQEYVNQVGQKLVGKLDESIFQFHFKVVDSSEINAFALPGGYIYVTIGILASFNSEAELAGVLGHEIGHVIAHHGVKQLTKSLGLTLLSLGGVVANPKQGGEWLMVSQSLFNQILLGYGREAELEADTLGFINTYQTGYDPGQMVDFLRGLKFKEMMSGQSYHSFQSTHPDTRERIIKAEDTVNSLLRRNKNIGLFKEEYLSHIAGLKYGGKRNSADKQLYPKEQFIDLYKVKDGDTFDSIAEQQLGDKKKSMDIAVLNNRRQNDQLKPGETIKLIRERS